MFELATGELRATLLGNHESWGHKRISGQETNIRIGNEHPDSLLTYPHPHNLSGYTQPIHEVPRHRAQQRQAGRRGFRAGTRGGSRRDRRTPDPRGVRAGTRGGYRSTRPSSAHSAPASSRLRPNDRQPWRRRRIHRRRPPAAAAPRPAPPTRPSKPVRARRCMRPGSTAGTSGAT